MSRNAKASLWTRHAQLLLPVSWRSWTDHATAGMVSQTDKSKSMPSWFHVNKEQLLSCLFTSDAHWRCACFVCWMEECWPAAAAAYTGRSAAGCSCCYCCGFSHTAPLCAQHMSNTSPHACPCITIWLLNPHQRFLEALLSLGVTLCLRITFFFSVFYTAFLSSFSWLHPCHWHSCTFPPVLNISYPLSSSSSISFSVSVMFVKTGL